MFRLLFSGLTATVLILFGAFLMFAGYKNRATFSALDERGVVVRADVTQVEWQERRSNKADSLYTVHLRFRTQDGRTVNAQTYVPVDQGRALRASPSAGMTIRYLPESPTTVEDASKADPSGEQSGVGQLMVLLGGLMLFVRFILAKRREAGDRAIAAKSRPGPARSKTYSR
jgi:hypothetical protein